MSALDIGKVALIPKGNYQDSTQYEYLDLVTYEGGMYVCIQACKGIIPTNLLYWKKQFSASGVDIIDDLNSTSTESALSANQGRVLKDMIGNVQGITDDIELYIDGENGNDTTGDGTENNPYKTITKALSTFGDNLNGHSVILDIAEAEYTEIVTINKHNGPIELKGHGDIQISSCQLDKSIVGITSGISFQFNTLSIANASTLHILSNDIELQCSSLIVQYNSSLITPNTCYIGTTLLVTANSGMTVDTLSGTGSVTVANNSNLYYDELLLTGAMDVDYPSSLLRDNSGGTELALLSDVNISSPQSGQALIYNANSGKWINGSGGSSVTVIDNLTSTSSTDALSAKQGNVLNGKVENILNSVGEADGIASLDANGRIPYTQLPESAMEFKGTWNASTNTPTLTNGTGTKGDFYIVSTAGTWQGIEFFVNDRIIYDGSMWNRLGGGNVVSVSGKTGVVTLDKGDVGLSNVDNTSDANKPVSTATQTALDGKANAASVTAGTAGTSSATSGSTLAVPYLNVNAQGVVTGYGTHTHTVTGFAASSHNQAASTITAGTLGGRVQANATAAATLTNAQLRDITLSTTDLTAGTSSLATGSLYFVYE